MFISWFKLPFNLRQTRQHCATLFPNTSHFISGQPPFTSCVTLKVPPPRSQCPSCWPKIVFRKLIHKSVPRQWCRFVLFPPPPQTPGTRSEPTSKDVQESFTSQLRFRRGSGYGICIRWCIKKHSLPFLAKKGGPMWGYTRVFSPLFGQTFLMDIIFIDNCEILLQLKIWISKRSFKFWTFESKKVGYWKGPSKSIQRCVE